MYKKSLELIIAAMLVIGAWFYAGHHAVEQYKTQQLIEQAEADKAQQQHYDELASNYEALKTERAKNARTIIKEVEKIVEKPIYRTVCVDQQGLDIANKALEGGK